MAYGKVQETITARGELEACSTCDVYCKGKSRNSLGGFRTTIQWIVENDAEVRRGRLLVKLNDAPLREELRARRVRGGMGSKRLDSSPRIAPSRTARTSTPSAAQKRL